MEQPPNLDHLFRERLYDAEVPPPAFVWPQVEQALRRRRRRFFGWLWLGLGLAGAGLWSLWRTDNAPALASLPQAAPTEQTLHPERQTEGKIHSPAALPPVTPPSARSDNRAEHKTAIRQKTLSKKPYPMGVEPLFISASPAAAPALSTLSSQEDDLAPVIAERSSPASLAAPLALLPARPGPLATFSAAPGLVLPKAKPFVLRKKKPLKNCYDFAQHPRAWLVDAYVGPSLPQRQLSAAQNEFDGYLQQRRSTERTDWAFNAGVRGSLVFGRHFLLRTGVHYEQMTEVFEYADPDFIQVTITQTTQLVDGMWQTVIDTIGISYGEHHIKTYNRFGLLEIPLLAGAEFRAGRAGVSLQAGASLNVLFWKRGTILDAQGKPESFTPGQAQASPVFRQRAGWSATASAQLFYHLRSRVRVFAEPHYSRAFRPLTLDGQPVAQRYTTWGLKLGVTKIFD